MAGVYENCYEDQFASSTESCSIAPFQSIDPSELLLYNPLQNSHETPSLASDYREPTTSWDDTALGQDLIHEPDELAPGTWDSFFESGPVHTEVSCLDLPPPAAVNEPDSFETTPSASESRKSSSPSTSNTPGKTTAGTLQRSLYCLDCPDLPPFLKLHEYNRHRKRHDRPHQCSVEDCGRRFGFKKDLQRHVKEKHQQWPSSETFFCQIVGCNRSADGSRGGFKRNSDLARHRRKVHKREQ